MIIKSSGHREYRHQISNQPIGRHELIERTSQINNESPRDSLF